MFLSDENKGFVWQLLSENKAFDNISDNSFENIKLIYENTFTQVSTMNNINLTDKNKVVISEMMKYLSEYKTMQKPNKKSVNVTRPLQEVKIQLDKDFENKQEEFIQLVKKPTQPEIDFNDNNDTPLDNDDMDQKLNTMMKMRQDELNQIIQPNPTKVTLDITNNEETNVKETNVKETNIQKTNIQETNVKVTNNNKKTNNDNLDCLDYMWSQWGDNTNNNKLSTNEKKVSFEVDDTLKIDKILANQAILLKEIMLIKKSINTTN